MKKIFTLIAAAFMAVGANAQGSYRVAENQAFTSKQEITDVENITVIMGEDTWVAGKADDHVEGYAAYVTGSTNPQDANGKKPGAATFDATTAKGCVVFFKPAIDGKLVIGIKQNKGADKPVYLFEGAQTEAFKKEGVAESWYGTIEANVKAGETYCLYQPATKVGFYGFDFTAGDGGGEGGETPEPPVSGNGGLISFGTKEAPAALEASWTVDGFTLTRTDTENKHAIDGNNAWFGDATAQVKYGARLKVGGKSGAKNSLALTIPTAGKLNICVRTASGTATDRNLVLTQNGSELYNKVVQDADNQSIEMEQNITEANPTGATAVYPIISVDVVAGTVAVEYPTGALNFYAFELVTSTGVKTIKAEDSNSDVIYNLAGQKVGKDFKGVVIMNGKKMIQK